MFVKTQNSVVLVEANTTPSYTLKRIILQMINLAEDQKLTVTILLLMKQVNLKILKPQKLKMKLRKKKVT